MDLIPRATQETYRYIANRGVAFDFQPAEDIILETIDQMHGKKAIILNTGKLTTLARVLAKASRAQLGKIRKAVIMGGGFRNSKLELNFPGQCAFHFSNTAGNPRSSPR